LRKLWAGGRLAVPAVLLPAIVLIAAGCGGSSGTGTGSTADTGGNGSTATPAETGSTTTPAKTGSITKAEFIKKADAICAEGKKQVQTEFAAYLEKNKIKKIPEGGESKAETEGREAEIIESIALPALQRQVDDIRALGFPAGESGQIEPFLDAVEGGIEKGDEDPQALFSGASKVFAKADGLAQKYGFKVCGNR
jgi:hypothetical protein